MQCHRRLERENFKRKGIITRLNMAERSHRVLAIRKPLELGSHI
jgi:hypothetical protein